MTADRLVPQAVELTPIDSQAKNLFNEFQRHFTIMKNIAAVMLVPKKNPRPALAGLAYEQH